MNRWLASIFAVPMLAILASPLAGFGYEVVAVANGGTIVGEVKYAGTPPPPEMIPITRDTAACGSEPKPSPILVVGADNGIQDVVVSLDVKKGKALEKPAQAPVLDQKNCEYHPVALLIPVNTTIEILNSDDVLHNVKTMPGSKTQFNLAQPKFKRKLTMDFKTPEIVQVECNVHGWMHAVVTVAEHPYYALTDANGSFKITDVPPGTYTLKLWHAKLGEQSQEVTVGEKEDVQVALELKSQ